MNIGVKRDGGGARLPDNIEEARDAKKHTSIKTSSSIPLVCLHRSLLFPNSRIPSRTLFRSLVEKELLLRVFQSAWTALCSGCSYGLNVCVKAVLLWDLCSVKLLQ